MERTLDVLMKRDHRGETDVPRCQDGVDKTFHPKGTSWTNSKCWTCTCLQSAMRCCHGGLMFQSKHMKHLTDNFPANCEVTYDYHTCTFKVFQKGNPAIRCTYSATGK
ncbi:beta-microseminoprotein-like [Electrophorus electricus]|uniref:beta-microseminoprotein-like n=1 Tax=Electrophorus electricus TaxID=8005 RepID=UPI0015CFCB02|nr:beta-microseminoprotein-like [Electrophorus electricus]